MKKFLLILLTGLLALSLFACTDKKNPQQQEPVRKPVRVAYDTFIQDSNGVDKCFWEDGQVIFDDHRNSGRQVEKSASLNVQTEYDMWFALNERDLDIANNYHPVEFEYDETKFEIKTNSDKENHFIVKVLQSCNKEKISIKLTSKSLLDDIVDENGEPVKAPSSPQTFSITISTVE